MSIMDKKENEMAAETTDKKKIIKEYLWITFAVVIMDIGIYVFKFPNNFSFGGVSGMAVRILQLFPHPRSTW